jgi:hypothetical protein
VESMSVLRTPEAEWRTFKDTVPAFTCAMLSAYVNMFGPRVAVTAGSAQ